MDIKRVVLFGALAFVVFSLWTDWQKDYPQVKPEQVIASNTQTLNEKMLPNMASASSPTAELAATDSVPATTSSDSYNKKIYVKTDVLDLAIDNQGNVVSTKLLSYPESSTDKNKPFTLLQDNKGFQYVANSSLFTVENQKVASIDEPYTSSKQNYELSPGQDTLTVTLTGQDVNGLTVNKHFTFKRGSYLIGVNFDIQNQGDSAWNGYMNTQLLRSSPKEDKTSMFHMGSYTGASYSVPGQSRYKKLSFKDMSKNSLDVESEGGWIAMQQHYFLTAWVPNANDKNRFYTRNYGSDYTIGNVSSEISVAPGTSKSVKSELYLGPEVTDVLKDISPGLELTVDYGWLWFISQILFSLMKSIYNLVGNWGWSIVLVTVLIKLAFYRLSAKSYKSMAGMRKLQPKMQSLRERYADDKAKMSQATMELYKQEKVNPLGGCLPILIQIPVFIALYWVLVESVELRQADFIFWIHDLASPDQYHVLPIIMGLTMFIQQKLNPAPPDPMQAKVMMFLPVVFTILFLNFPAGLVLYWTVNNSLSILQQWYITRKYGDAPTTKKLAAVK
ncbi:MAG: membrane protein insertase YidC [Legionellaceae bacterium]|nr:membrane protein insertase YidC [Legionellaceae bacterium]